MKKFTRITINPEIVNGQPCIKDTRITVKRVVEAVALYQDWNRVIEEYPGLTTDDIVQALEWAAISINEESIILDVA